MAERLPNGYVKTVLLLMAGFIAVTNLAGCGLARKHMLNSDIQRMTNERDALIESTRELDPIREKVWMGAMKDDPPLSMLTLSEKPTDAEKPAIAKWHKISAIYKTKIIAIGQEYFPHAVGAMEEMYSTRSGLIVELHDQSISYGEYNRRVQQAYTKYAQQVSNIELQQSRIEQMRPPSPKTSFSCYTIGNQTHCN